jgi:hypothetical protein
VGPRRNGGIAVHIVLRMLSSAEENYTTNQDA